MNFDFSEDQKSLKEQANRFLAKNCSLRSVRQVVNEKKSIDERLWHQIVELGWCGTAIPEEYGGLGLGYLELCVLAEELGRVLAPVPFESSIFLFAEAISQFGSGEQKKQFLPKLINGKLRGTFAFAENVGDLSKRNIRTSYENGKINGEKIAVYDGDIADFAVVLVRKKKNDNDCDLQLVIVDLKNPKVTRQKVESLDESHSRTNISFDAVEAQALVSIKDLEELQILLNRSAILFAFSQLGGADACLSMAVDYAHKRYAFGRPIGSFQAIKHKLTDAYVLNELARSNAYYGAWALSTNAKELGLAAAAARISATQAFEYAAKENIQTHGGVGFTWESDCHLFYKRSKELSLLLGSQRVWKENLVKNLEYKESI